MWYRAGTILYLTVSIYTIYITIYHNISQYIELVNMQQPWLEEENGCDLEMVPTRVSCLPLPVAVEFLLSSAYWAL